MRAARLDLVGSVVVELLEVLVEHMGNFAQVLVVLFLVAPSTPGVEDDWVDSVDVGGVLQVEQGQGFVVGLG